MRQQHPQGMHGRALRSLLTIGLGLVMAACGDATGPAATGGITFDLTGLPSGASGEIRLTRGSTVKVLTAGSSLEGLDAGEWTLTASTITIDNVEYAPQPATQTVNIPARSVGSAKVVWTASSGAISLALSGLPAGVDGSVLVTGPSNFSSVATASTLLVKLKPGTYTVTGRDVRASAGAFRADPLSQTLNVVASAVSVSVTVAYGPAPATIEVAISGLPASSAPNVNLTAPSGDIVPVLSTTRISPAAPGRWRLAAANVQSGGFTYVASPTSRDTSVSQGDTLRFAVNYSVNTGALAVAVMGLPQGATGSVNISGPGGFARAVTATTTLTDLTPGTYTVTADSVVRNSVAWRAVPPTQQVTVSASIIAAPATIAYAAVTGTLVVSVSGVPNGAAGSVRVTGPYGFDRTVATTTVFSMIAAGPYTIAAAPIVAGAVPYDVVPATVNRAVAISGRDSLDMNYQNATGSLQVTVSGLPGGTNGALTLTGNSQTFNISASTTLQNLTPGTYTLTASSVTSGVSTYAGSPTTQMVTIARQVQGAVSVSYIIANGSIAVAITGLPVQATGSVTVTGPGAFSQVVTVTQTLTGLLPGTYTVVADSVVRSGFAYRPSPATQPATVTASVTAAPANVAYAAVSGTLVVAVTGVPSGSTGSVRVTGPYGFDRTISSTTIFTPTAAGPFTITASPLSAAGVPYDVSPATVNRTVTINGRDSLAMAYQNASGSLALTVSGLPGGVNAAVTLTGNSQTTNLTGSTTVQNLTAGSYALAAVAVSSGGTTYTPSPASQSVSITRQTQSAATITYASSVSANIDLVLNSAYVTQATQKMDGSVPLVAGRDALLRVFASADQVNSVSATVRARIYEGAALLQTSTLTRAASSVPTAIDESSLASSWNLVILGVNVRPTMRILVDIDPTNAVTESNESNNIWPANGTPQSLTVTTTPAFNVTFVPVTVNGLTGNVSAANMDQFLVSAKRVWPIAQVNASVRPVAFSSNNDTLSLVSNDNNGKWTTILSEINTLRATDAAPSTMHYFGVVKVTYNSGVAGYGYVPGRTAIGWDYLPSGDGVAAHEWGHNFGRAHAPCGGVASPDPSFPYPGGLIGVYGWNPTTNALVVPTTSDLMGYCNPTWVSDYNWTNAMSYRQTSGAVSSAGNASDGLLVWGRVVNGTVILEPAFRVTAQPTAAVSRPTHYVEALDANGAVLLELPIIADRVDHATDRDERQFAVVVSWTAAFEQALSQVRVRDVRTPLLSASRASVSAVSARLARGMRTAQPLAMPDPQPVLESATAGRTRVRWNSAAYPMVMVRDARTGLVMGYMRSSGESMAFGGRTVELVYSDGVRSVVRGGLR